MGSFFRCWIFHHWRPSFTYRSTQSSYPRNQKFQFHFCCSSNFRPKSSHHPPTFLASRRIPTYIIPSNLSRRLSSTTSLPIKHGHQHLCSPLHNPLPYNLSTRPPRLRKSIQFRIQPASCRWKRRRDGRTSHPSYG